jgi:hypothetical protein
MKNYVFIATIFCFVTTLSCNKEDGSDNENNSVITKDSNVSISVADKEIDSVSVDVDNDGSPDIRLLGSNSKYAAYQNPANIRLMQVELLNDDISIAYTLQYSNYSNGLRIYNFGNSSLFLFYAKSFFKGNVIDSSADYVHVQLCSTSSYVANDVPGYYYNESEGDFNNSSGYLAYFINKPDGRHYGWIKLSNSDNSMNAILISSAYCVMTGKPIEINQ